MPKTSYITLEEVLAIHHDQVERYGGSHGIRDINLLASAIERPKSSFMGEDLYPTIFDKAAALMHSILLNHPFLDGNKRTGIISASLLLHLNGWGLQAKQKELVGATLAVESKNWNLEQISKWLKEHSAKIPR